MPPLPPAARGAARSFAWNPVADFSRTWPNDDHSDGRQPAETFGAFVTAIGLAILAVGVTAVGRAQLTRQMPMMRPGVLIAAGGQFVLLVGLVALAVQSSRAQKSRRAAEATSLQTVMSPIGYAVAVQRAPVGSPIWQPASVHSGQSAQIAQLKAQLACLSQQLDQLS